MAGERIAEAELDELGIDGDRKVLVKGRNGRVITSPTHPKLLGLKGTIAADGAPQISGRPWNSMEALDLVRTAVGLAPNYFITKGRSALMSSRDRKTACRSEGGNRRRVVAYAAAHIRFAPGESRRGHSDSAAAARTFDGHHNHALYAHKSRLEACGSREARRVW